MAVYTAATIGLQNGPRKMMEEWWALPRTLRGGTTAMRIERTRYLPLTAAETKDFALYEKRLAKTRLWPAYSEAVADLASLPFQQAMTLEGVELLPMELRPIVTNADREGTSLWSFMCTVFKDAIDRGMGLFIADSVPAAEDGLKQDKAEEIDARPYFRRIHPDSLVGFLTERRFGREVLTDLRIKDTSASTSNTGADTTIERIQHWTETDVEEWERDMQQTVTQENQAAAAAGNSSTGAWRLVKGPRPHGFPDGIPLNVVYTKKVGTLTAQPPLEDLAWENVAHWQARSHQDDALSYCRAPIFSGSGVDTKTRDEKPVMGAGATVMSTSPDATFKFVEITGTSLQAGERQIDKIEQTCAHLAKKPLVQANGPNTATGEVRADVREKAVAQEWTEGLEWAFYRGFQMLAKWVKAELPESFDLRLFRDFAILGAGAAQDVQAMQVDVREGRMSLRAYLAEMVRRGKRAESFDVEEELAELEGAEAAKAEKHMNILAMQTKAQRPENQPPPKEGDEPADGGGQKAA